MTQLTNSDRCNRYLRWPRYTSEYMFICIEAIALLIVTCGWRISIAAEGRPESHTAPTVAQAKRGADDSGDIDSYVKGKVPCHCAYCTYKFKLVVNNNDSVCRHMEDVYNGKFTRMFDTRGFSVSDQGGFRLWMTYPTSPEYRAIHWRFGGHTIDRGGTKFHFNLPTASFDIDNDGNPEFVVRAPGIGIAPDAQPEEFYVYKDSGPGNPKNYFEDARFLTSGGYYFRPFLLNGVFYLSYYSVNWPDRDIPPKDLCVPPPKQEMIVEKYIGGSKYANASKFGTQKTQLICKFAMLRTCSGQ